MNKQVVIEVRRINFKSSLPFVRKIVYEHDNGGVTLLRIVDSDGVVVLVADVYATYPQPKINAIETEMEDINNQLVLELYNLNVFFRDFPIGEEQYIGENVIYKFNGNKIKTKILGWNNDLSLYEVENFLFLVSPDDLYIDGVSISDLLIYG